MEWGINLVYKNKKLNLNAKLIISLVLLMILVIASIGISINNVLKKEFEQYIIKNNEDEVLKLVSSIEYEYEEGEWNLSKIERIGDDAISKGIFIEVYDKNNNLVWGAMKYNRGLCHQVIGNIKNNMNYMENNWNEEYIEHRFDLENKDNEVIGSINIGSYGSLYYMDNDVDFLKDINKVITIIGVIMTLITMTIAILISKNISKPIEVVSNMANSMSKGGYNKKIDYESNVNEIDTLINAINNLSYKLEEQEKLRKILTTDISHELRTPLTSIQTHLEALIDGIWEADTERLISVSEEVVRLTSLVNKLSDLSKFESEKNKLNMTKVNLKKLIKNIVYNNEIRSLEKNISIKLDIEDINTYLDKDKISQVITNLLSNAIRYTNNNGNIQIRAYKENEYIKMIFKDNGIGIPNDSLEHIFERFYRVDKSRSKSTGGIGVGLTIVKSIIDSHNGTIEVKSKENEGSEFIVLLPLIESIL